MSDRKYRHRGYQDDDRDRQPQQRPSRPPRDPRDYSSGPRGRGVGSAAEVSFKCALCGRQQKQPEIATDTTCPGCGKPLHTCTNCSFFNSGARFECTKPIEARIESKAKANDCPLFEPKVVRTIKADAGGPKPTDARAAFDALFKK